MSSEPQLSAKQKLLFATCFIALIATSFGFISRAFMLTDWGEAFELSQTQLGEIFGAGLWPFAISIILISLVVDYIGYKIALWFAFLMHIISGFLTITASGYTTLYWAAFVGALGAGAVEAVINPVIAAMFPRAKTKWLNILHAGWPCGFVLAGILTIMMGDDTAWEIKVALVFIPVIIYGILLLRCKFPVGENVAAGVPYKEMLAEPGPIGIFIPTVLILEELGHVFGGKNWELSMGNNLFVTLLAVSILIAVAYGIYVRTLGKPMYVFMLIVMLALATTELGTDGWIKDLMEPAMELIGLNGGWILIYTAFIMTVLRLLTGPILKVTKLSPLGLLSCSCVAVIIGIVWLSKIDTAAGLAILIAATIYGAGQCFFWPTTLGFISERFPKGGALSLNAIGGVGMLGVGILGGPWLGYIQDISIQAQLEADQPALYAEVIGDDESSMFGSYKPIDQAKVKALVSAIDDGTKPELTTEFVSADAVNEKLDAVQKQAKSNALFTVSGLPLLMLISYLGLMFYFRSKGGYKPIELDTGTAPDSHGDMSSV